MPCVGGRYFHDIDLDYRSRRPTRSPNRRRSCCSAPAWSDSCDGGVEVYAMCRRRRTSTRLV